MYLLGQYLIGKGISFRNTFYEVVHVDETKLHVRTIFLTPALNLPLFYSNTTKEILISEWLDLNSWPLTYDLEDYQVFEEAVVFFASAAKTTQKYGYVSADVYLGPTVSMARSAVVVGHCILSQTTLSERVFLSFKREEEKPTFVHHSSFAEFTHLEVINAPEYVKVVTPPLQYYKGKWRGI